MWNSFTTHSEQVYSQNIGCDTQVEEHSYKQMQNLEIIIQQLFPKD
jgi:hypothetical protein